MSDSIDPEGSLNYAIRLSERALRDIDLATLHFAETAGVEVAIAWSDGLYEQLKSLSSSPRKFGHPRERFKGEVRQMIYRRQGSRVSFRILFAIRDEDPSKLDAPTVTILHIRHAAARPIPRKEARAIESTD